VLAVELAPLVKRSSHDVDAHAGVERSRSRTAWATARRGGASPRADRGDPLVAGALVRLTAP